MAIESVEKKQGKSEINGDLLTYCLRLGDNAMVLAQRLSEWVRNSPTIELDIAFANIALDHVGQARMLYSYAGEIEGVGRDEDQLAFLRDEREFGNVLLAELPNGDFAKSVLRLFFYSAWALQLYEGLRQSNNERLSAIAGKAVLEVRYQLKHSAEWVVRLGDGTDESHRRIEAALTDLWPFVGELFEADDVEVRLADAGIGVDPASLKAAWDKTVNDVFARANLTRPEDDWHLTGGRHGQHTEQMGYLLAEMQVLQRTYPGCEW